MDAFGQVLADAYLARCAASGAEPQAAKAEKERTKLHRAPLVIAVCAVRRDDDGGKYPWIDQLGAAFAAAENACLAATALGYGSMWRTGDASWDPAVLSALGLDAEHDAVVGYLYLGTPDHQHEPHDPDLKGLVAHYGR
jgi:nitroreductase